ncbi:hypothetical protein POM88_010715 [Heracleum sosnowskyi]|uniref:Uncharacterized protein n=1 Tax=Heracleum sosnowskyi TaxID=360622 RepID=A0AAD8IT58_9APIA|nr:hypothetical protein POM88_010715 [Heracleum sosnowskyi]
MAKFIKFIFFILLFFILLNEGNSSCFQCTSFAICHVTVQQIENRPGSAEWVVQITNPYGCSQKNIILSCPGFKPRFKPNPSLITYDANHIYVQPTIPAYGSMSFVYLSVPKFNMVPLSSTVCC